jgi:hypothetical protein
MLLGGFSETVEFKGSLNIYRTSDSTIQAAIESLPFYKRGLIVLYSESEISVQGDEGTSGQVDELTSGQVDKETRVQVIASVKTYQDAITYLMSNFGYSRQKLQRPDAILKACEEKNVSFPNLMTE